jgi:hypothetical protein
MKHLRKRPSVADKGLPQWMVFRKNATQARHRIDEALVLPCSMTPQRHAFFTTLT